MPYAVASDGIRLHYQDIGRHGAPVVLLIQGLGADKNGWIAQRPALMLRYRVIAFDNRGAGRSDKPFGPYTLEQMADDAVAVLDACDVDRAHVVGASMGGAITQLVYLRHPERVRSMVLACSACRNVPWREELLQSWADLAMSKGMGVMAHHAGRWVIGPRSFRRLWPAVGWLGPLAMGRVPHAFAAQVKAIISVNDGQADNLRDVKVPTLIMVGNQDILTPRADSEEMNELIPGSELVVISGAAHGFMIEHASTFNRVLKEFLERVSHERADAVGSPVALVG
ncbi:MAG: alpha/beta fold hydrolase [Ilumatobacteraceae bacterium]|jgi:3-oxoadipate enol-lactonase